MWVYMCVCGRCAAVGPDWMGRGRRSGNNVAFCTGSRCDVFCNELCKLAPRPQRSRDKNGLLPRQRTGEIWLDKKGLKSRRKTFLCDFPQFQLLFGLVELSCARQVKHWFSGMAWAGLFFHFKLTSSSMWAFISFSLGASTLLIRVISILPPRFNFFQHSVRICVSLH